MGTGPRASLPTSLRSLTELPTSAMWRAVRRRDLGYACYLYFGVMLAVAFTLRGLPPDTWLQTAVADRLSGTVLFGFALAGLVGVGVSISAWRDRPLVLLALMTVALPWVLWFAESLVPVASVLYTMLALFFPIRWFLALRGRVLAAADPRD